MAEEINIDILIETANSVKSIGEAKKAIKDLKSAVLGVEEGSEAFEKLNKAAGKLNDRLNDVNEQVKIFSTDSKLEALSNQFGLVGSKIKSLDFAGAAAEAKKLAIATKSISFGEATKGLKDLGSTFLSVGKSLLFNPLFAIPAIIVGLSVALYKLKDDIAVVGLAFKVVTDIFDGAVKALKKFTDQIGLTNFAGKKAAEDTIVISGKVTKAVVERYDREIALAEAAGEKTEKLEYAKSLAVIEATKGEIKANQAAYEAGVITLEEKQKKQEEFNELLKKTELEKAVTLVKISKDTQDAIDKREEESEKKRIKREEERLKKLQEEINLKNRLLAEQDAEVEKANEKGEADLKARIQAEQDSEVKRVEEDAAATRKIFENRVAQEEIQNEFNLTQEQVDAEFARRRVENQYLTDQEIYKSIFDTEQDKIELAQKTAEEEDRIQKQKLQNTIAYANAGLNALTSIDNLLVTIEENNRKKGEKQSLASQKKAFNRKKALGIASAAISTAEAIIGYNANPGFPLGIPLAIAAGVTGAASIAAIASQKFQPAGESGSSGGGGGVPPLPTSSISFGGGNDIANKTFQPSASLITPTFTGTAGGFSGNNQTPVRAYVVESEMTEAQLRAERFRQRAEMR